MKWCDEYGGCVPAGMLEREVVVSFLTVTDGRNSHAF